MRDLLLRVIEKRAVEHLALVNTWIETNHLPLPQRNLLRLVITHELGEVGYDERGRESELGTRLEELIDWLGPTEEDS